VTVDAGAATPDEPDEQHRLLLLQDLDLLADQLAVRRRNLPERAALATLDAQMAELQAAVAARDTTRRAVVTEPERLEAELAGADARDGDLSAKLKTIFVPREAEALMAEQRTLAGRRAELEDQILDRMGQVVDLDDQDATTAKAADELEAERVGAREALAAAEREVDQQLAELAARRVDVVPTVPEALLTRYEALRRTHSGVAVARLEGGRCLGCHLTLSTSELDRIRHEPSDALVECEHCGRLLVR
jgi:predicted  nucleic acid-binding Zn-ribbon protein